MTEFGTFDMEMLGITQDQIEKVDSSEAEVVSRVLMSRIKDITANIRPDGITFNATCVRSMVGVIHIQMYIDRGSCNVAYADGKVTFLDCSLPAHA